MASTISNEAEITKIIKNDKWMMKVLCVAEEINLPDWWIGAGFLRNKVWNYIEDKDYEQTRDVDLVYFNQTDTSEKTDWDLDENINKKFPFANWEIRNQARMHYKNGFEPFVSTHDGIAHWTETATAIAVKINKGEIRYHFCYGTDDLFNLIARPTPYCNSDELLKLFRERIDTKNWQQKWPNLRIELK